MGKFSWFTQDTNKQIGSDERNTITVTMFDNKGNSWKEDNYKGYGIFGGKDYYELLAEMNGYDSNRNLGIGIIFDKTKTDPLFPALYQNADSFKPNEHYFKEEAPIVPDQSWYEEDEEDYEDWDDDDYNVDEED